MYTQSTEGVRVTVTPIYLAAQSSPSQDLYVWAYKVQIENESEVAVQLRYRHWQITNAVGVVERVDGPGVVGEQPLIKPGHSFEYTSGCPLTTPSGVMVGTYDMETADGRMLEVAIPAFSLDSPHESKRLN